MRFYLYRVCLALCVMLQYPVNAAKDSIPSRGTEIPKVSERINVTVVLEGYTKNIPGLGITINDPNERFTTEDLAERTLKILKKELCIGEVLELYNSEKVQMYCRGHLVTMIDKNDWTEEIVLNFFAKKINRPS